MASIVPYVVGGLVAVGAMEYGPAVSQHLGVSPSIAQTSQSNVPARPVAAAKGDRFAAAAHSAQALEVATVEVIGLGNTAIVYRHRDGRELFRTDPLDNVTVVTKGFVLPQVTVRRDATSRVTPVRMRDIDEQRQDEQRQQAPERSSPVTPQQEPASRPEKLPVGCESSFSPVASPAMAHHFGRCMAGTDRQPALAALSG